MEYLVKLTLGVVAQDHAEAVKRITDAVNSSRTIRIETIDKVEREKK